MTQVRPISSPLSMGPFYLTSDLISVLKLFATLKYCYKVVFLFQSSLVITVFKFSKFVFHFLSYFSPTICIHFFIKISIQILLYKFSILQLYHSKRYIEISF